MNNDVWEGKWKQMRGHAKEWWGKLTNDEIDRVQGQRDILLGLLQEKYGFDRAQAEQEINRRMKELERKPVHTI